MKRAKSCARSGPALKNCCQQRALRFALHPLGNHPQIERPGHGDDCAQNGPVARVGGDVVG
jgi:hypothetical protein